MINHQMTNTLSDKVAVNNVPINVSDWRVLIVDDIWDNISIAEIILSSQGAEVETAEDGLEGLQAAKTFNPNLIITDLSMPEMDGWEMLKQLRQSEDTTSIPVIALTAHALLSDAERVMSAGFDGYITKPFSVLSLVEDIQTILKDCERAD